MNRFDVQRHNIMQLSIADACQRYNNTQSRPYKLKLRTMLILAKGQLHNLAARARSNRLCAGHAALNVVRSDIKLIETTISRF